MQPRPTRQPVPQGGQDHPIIRLLSDALDLPFENVNCRRNGSTSALNLASLLSLVAIGSSTTRTSD
ncbi:MAG TPA: hypothetical protein VGU71_00525 [Candidatus Dormibacteraeota bacterium]|nr:hypothetical protein [Candidatus Dormibacteraeota bacterium]